MNKQKKIGLAVLVVILLYAAISVFFQYHYFIGTKVNGYSCGFRSVSKTKELIKEDIKAYKITIKERNKKKESISFSQVNLAFKDDGKLEKIKAQQKGYAEADPTADVGGADACRKIAILSSLAYGKFLNYEDIYTEGITKITPADMEYAKELGMTIKLLATSVDGVDMNGLRDLGDSLKEKLGEGVIVLASSNEGKVNLVAMATDAAIKSGAHAGNLIKAIASKVGGGGGGRPNMAQAGGKNPAGIPDAIASVKDALSGMIK